MLSNTKTECSECGKIIICVHRRHKTLQYCQSCYQRLFKALTCPSCKNIVRLPVHFPNAVCDNCERLKPCIRCGKQGKDVVRLSKYGTVCNSCFIYFTTPKVCSECAMESRRYRRGTDLDPNAILCERCARKNTHGTCHTCRRYRKLLQSKDNSTSICFKCYSLGAIPCKRCKVLHPAGFGSICEQCYREDLLERRGAITVNLFATDVFRALFYEFSQWLAANKGILVASIQANKYAPLLQQIENHWGQLPSYKELVSRFSVAYLRRFKRLIDWLSEQKYLKTDAEVKTWDSETRIIEKQISHSNLTETIELICRKYLTSLMHQVSTENLKIRTARLYMCAAIGFSKVADRNHSQELNQSALVKYLKSAPGQKASITRFVNYLNLELHTDLHLPTIAKTNSVRIKRERKLAEKMYKLLSRAMDHDPGKNMEWTVLSLQFFHGLSVNTCKSLIKSSSFQEVQDGHEFNINNQAFWVPSLKYAAEHIRNQTVDFDNVKLLPMTRS
uniref:FIGfam110555 n=1 Tax=Rheinheimera sp. BAL341 TaxID=1708203 RepID=A0A486XUL5_9GAMM